MAKERRDSKNRILQKGEYQKPDGRYMYKYVDQHGNARFLYSWTLTKSDRAPKGKTPGPCLRDLEKSVAADLHDGVDTQSAKKMTLSELFDRYMESKRSLKPTTRSHYRYVFNHLVKDTLGGMRITDIKYSDIKRLYNHLLYDNGVTIATIKNLDICIHPVFAMAVRDGYIRKNPAAGVLSEVKKESGLRQESRFALTIDQQERFIRFTKESKVYSKWYVLFAFLLGTGCRIGEACAVTWDDFDFDNNLIQVNKSLRYYPDEETGKYVASILTPKTKAGARFIPMLPEIREILWREKLRQLRDGMCCVEIDGVKGFVFSNTEGDYIRPTAIDRIMYSLVNNYNKKENQLAEKEGRDPVLLPRFSPHILRHTFCTRLCESNMNIKVVQEIMGHANISITMDIYNNVTMEFKQSSFDGISTAIKFG